MKETVYKFLPSAMILAFLIINISFGMAQGRYNGYVITNEGDTIKGVLELGGEALRTVRVSFTDYEVRKKVDVEPFQVKAYYANGKLYESKVYNVDDGLDYGYAVFMESVESGHVNLYRYWNNRKKRYEMILEGDDKKMTLVSRIGFRKQMVEYFKEYSLLTAKIVRNVYNLEDLRSIVTEYNEWKSKMLLDALSKQK